MRWFDFASFQPVTFSVRRSILSFATFFFLASCTSGDRAVDPGADQSSPELLSFEVLSENGQSFAMWEANEPVRAVLEYGQSREELYRHSYSGSKEYKTSGMVKLVAVPEGTYAWTARLRDVAGNEIARTLPEQPTFTVAAAAQEELLFFAMIDVGWGDALFLRAPDGKTTLIDCGLPIDGSTVRRFLAHEGVTALDFASLTHLHEDHIGGFYGDEEKRSDGVFRVFNAGASVIPCRTFLDIRNKSFTIRHYRKLLSCIDGNPILGQHVLLEWGASSEFEPALRWGDGLRVDLLSAGKKESIIPDFIQPAQTGSAENNDSMVYRVQFRNFVLLLMGDAEFSTENFMMDHWPAEFLQSSVLKVGHHGAEDASSEKFVSLVNPRAAFISNALSENPGVEHASVMARFREQGADFYASDRVMPNRQESGARGDVLLWTDGDAFTVVAVPTRFE
ncbi:MAG TPA: MBL fold metallo-hydrolase [bacterium]|nr:MBL fold metallo-hydrolase [bacterium]